MHECLTFVQREVRFSLNYCRSSCKRTPSGHEKSVQNWSWPLMRMQKYRVCMRVGINRFYEGGHK